jgi:hypothetical protein
MRKLQQVCQRTVQRTGPRRTVDRECRTGQTGPRITTTAATASTGIAGLGRTCTWQIAPQISCRIMRKLQQVCQRTVHRTGSRRTVDRECRTRQTERKHMSATVAVITMCTTVALSLSLRDSSSRVVPSRTSVPSCKSPSTRVPIAHGAEEEQKLQQQPAIAAAM